MFEVQGLARHYAVRAGGGKKRWLRAVDGVDLAVYPGEVLALVGESGCGKSTLARLLLRLEQPTAGVVRYGGRDVWGLGRREVAQFRREVQLIFQDPYASLDPRLTVGEIVGEGLVIHGLARGAALRRRVEELLEQVGLPPEAVAAYPHEFSGGQRQRVGIARALAVEPRFLVADEPVSALDVSVQAQVLNLLQDLRAARGLTYLIISHDLRLVDHLADRVAVMYLGRVVELGPVAMVFESPLHPYTAALRAAVPVPDPSRVEPPRVLAGEVPSPLEPPGGCPFHPRCPEAFGPCADQPPVPATPAPGRTVCCHLYR